jgi:acyl-CoA synthetase (NDP forming)
MKYPEVMAEQDRHLVDMIAAIKRDGPPVWCPVMLKLYSETITHKTDVAGVQLNLGDGSS